MKPSYLVVLAMAAVAQQKVPGEKDDHPDLVIQRCTAPGQCVDEQTKVVLDANWRWLHKQNKNDGACFDKGDFIQDCKDSDEWCAKHCYVTHLTRDDYNRTYGVTTPGHGKLNLRYRNRHDHGVSIGSRLYLLDPDDRYKMFHLNNKEFTFDADVSQLDCGLNGALYFVEMEPDGHMTETNTAGSAYGTGYCDAQCPHDVKYIYGKPNSLEYSKGEDGKPGGGKYGICCTEMDIWEANKHSNAYTPHSCLPGYKRCETNDECGEGEGNRYKGFCDKDGCDFNPFRNGDTGFYGPGKTVNTDKKVTVITQFITHDGTDEGQLTEIRRLYVQDGNVFENPKASWSAEGVNYDAKGINDPFCYAEKKIFGELEKDDFSEKDGLQPMGGAFNRGMVLVLSIWTDPVSKMNWLDSTTGEGRGAARGTCDPAKGNPENYNKNEFNNIYTEFANIRYGPLGSTFVNNEKEKIPSVPASRPIDAKNPKTPQDNNNYENDVFQYPPGVTPNTGEGGSGGKDPNTRPGAINPPASSPPASSPTGSSSSPPSSSGSSSSPPASAPIGGDATSPSPNGNNSPPSGSGSSSDGSGGSDSSPSSPGSPPASSPSGGDATSPSPPPSNPSSSTSSGNNGGNGNTGGNSNNNSPASAPAAPPASELASGAEMINMSLMGVTSAMICAIMALRFIQ